MPSLSTHTSCPRHINMRTYSAGINSFICLKKVIQLVAKILCRYLIVEQCSLQIFLNALCSRPVEILENTVMISQPRGNIIHISRFKE